MRINVNKKHVCNSSEFKDAHVSKSSNEPGTNIATAGSLREITCVNIPCINDRTKLSTD